MDDKTRREIALWRYAVLGPLVSARLDHGDRRALFRETAQRIHEDPRTGRGKKVSARTVESWFYAYRRRGVEGLEPSVRVDHGSTTAITPELTDLIIRSKQARPRRSVPQIIRILERARRVPPGELSRSTVLRVLRRNEIPTHRPRQHEGKHRLAFLPEHANDLWIGDAMHGPRVRVGDKRHKAYLLSVIDVATRSILGSEFRLSESAVEHEVILKQTLQIHGRPRTYYVDRGAAYKSDSLRSICADIGVELLHTETRDAEAKGAIERWHRTWRAEVGVELEGQDYDLEYLNAVHRAWLAREYHKRTHATTGREPMRHYLEEIENGHHRDLPADVDLNLTFWHRVTRTVRRDNTINVGGARFEVNVMGLSGRRVQVRFDPSDHTVNPKIFEGKRFLSDTRPLDLIANATRRRRRQPVADSTSVVDPVDAVHDLLEEHYGSAAESEDAT